MTPRDLYIFDLDGTLSDASHRQPILADTTNSHRWDMFYDLCDKDLPRHGVIKVLDVLKASSDIWIWSGRTRRVEAKTLGWLDRHRIQFDNLRMRSEQDYTPDDKLKRSWYESMLPDDKARLVATFDDRDRIVRMWRTLGVQCFQVNYGDF